MSRVKYGLLHNHTEHSMKDSGMSCIELVNTAKEMGAPALALTDHGTLFGVYPFMKACKDAGIKGVPGVEAYVRDPETDKRLHMVLLPVDYTGYCAISQAVTSSNENLVRGIPEMDDQVLEKYFAEGSPGHGHVIATSACIGGVLAGRILANKAVHEAMAKKKTALSKLESPEDPEYLAEKDALARASEKRARAEEARELAKEAAKPGAFSQRKKAAKLLKSKDAAAYKAQMAAIDADIEEAQNKLIHWRKEAVSLKKEETLLRQKVKANEARHAKWRAAMAELSSLEGSLKSEQDLFESARARAVRLDSIFGHGNFYVELQYHGIPGEAVCMPQLAVLAAELGLPVCAANDAHYARGTAQDLRLRQILHSMRFQKWEEERAGDREYWLKDDSQLYGMLTKILPASDAAAAMEGVGDIFERCNVVFPEALHAPQYAEGGAKEALRNMCIEGIPKRYGCNWTAEMQQRVEYELSVIEKLGYSDYLMIVQDFIAEGKRLGRNNPEGVGFAVGPGRGSACGSIVCYLTGITDIDPLRHNLLFERFLNKDRVSMPDIDTDLSQEVREKVIDYVKGVYGEKAVCCIGTRGTLGAKGAIRRAAASLGLEQANDSKMYYSLGERLSAVISKDDTKATLSGYQAELMAECGTDKNALQIISDALLLEKVVIQAGMHAAGVIISDDGDVSGHVPLMYNTGKGRWCSQCDMTEAESDAGLLKMDFLSLINLDIISETQRSIKRNRGLTINMEDIGKLLGPDGRETGACPHGSVFDEIFAKGATTGVFQFESAGMKRMLKAFKPYGIDDIILLVAMFRPGPMSYIDAVTAVKHGKAAPHYIAPGMDAILDSTYGYPVYQEQIMQIFNKIAGFSLGEADIIRRYMSKKKESKFAAYKDKFIEGVIHAGAKRPDAEDFWNQLLEFSKYAFNKSHAAAYAYVAYYTAWLKLNYPEEYMSALLNHAKPDKVPSIIAECRAMDLEILPPNINAVTADFGYTEGAIVFGLGKIKGLSGASEVLEARQSGAFTSFYDFMLRAHTKTDRTRALISAGAMDCFCGNRLAMHEIVEPMAKAVKKAQEKRREMENEPEPARKDRLRQQMESYLERARKMEPDVTLPEDKRARLEQEKELLGAYVSGHPVCAYTQDACKSGPKLCNLQPGHGVACGIVTQVKNTRRKRDGAVMCVFTLEDETGSVDAFLSGEAYPENSKSVFTGAALAVSGRIWADEESQIKLTATGLRALKPNKRTAMISIMHLGEWNELAVRLGRECSGEDFRLIVHDRSTGLFHEALGTYSDVILFPCYGAEEVSVYPHMHNPGCS